jgi:hypothetical protein
MTGLRFVHAFAWPFGIGVRIDMWTGLPDEAF